MPTCLKYSPLVTDAGPYYTIYLGNATSTGLAAGGAVIARPLVPDTATTAVANCAVVSITGAEWVALQQSISSGSSGTVQTPTPQNWQELGNMSIQDAQVISAYIGLLWAGVWGFKQIAKAISINEGNQDE